MHYFVGNGQLEEDHVRISYRIIIVACSIHVAVNAVALQHVSLEIDTEYDVTDTNSIMKLTISDMNTKHGTKWNDQRILIYNSIIYSIIFNNINKEGRTRDFVN